jgi:hypothetical protein
MKLADQPAHREKVRDGPKPGGPRSAAVKKLKIGLAFLGERRLIAFRS